MRVGSLFSGIGGLDLGLERAGMQVVWQCEIDTFCRRVLAHHWPGVHCYEDVRDITADAPGVDLICGGFPCQPVSLAGKRKGQEDERWLWPEFARVIGEIRPRWVLVENVPGITTRGLGDVLASLAALGFDAEWDVVSAASVGAPHLRERIFVVAHSDTLGRDRWPRIFREARWAELANGGRPFQHPDSSTVESWWEWRRIAQASGSEWRAVEPDVGRVAHGVPERLAQLRSLGNAVVPQVSEFVGRLIIESREEAA